MISVTEPLNINIDIGSNITDATGAGIVSGDVKPNIGSVFVAEMVGGLRYLFKIDSVKLTTYHSATKYIITYHMAQVILNDDDSAYVNLMNKTRKTYLWNEESAENGGNPLVDADSLSSRMNLQCIIDNLTLDYFSTFIDRDTHLLTYINGNVKLYDYELVNFVDNVMTIERQFGMERIAVNKHNDHNVTILNKLINRNYEWLKKISTTVTIKGRNLFNTHRELSNAKYHPISHIAVTSPVSTLESGVDIRSLLPVESTEHDPSVINAIGNDNSYIFSSDFYNDSPKGKLEGIVDSYLKTGDFSLPIFEEILDNYKEWNLLERFYYTPILVLLTKTKLR